MKRSANKITLKQVIDTMNEGFKQVNTRIDDLEKNVNMRIDRIETRLDYIVTANNLKDRK